MRQTSIAPPKKKEERERDERGFVKWLKAYEIVVVGSSDWKWESERNEFLMKDEITQIWRRREKKKEEVLLFESVEN